MLIADREITQPLALTNSPANFQGVLGLILAGYVPLAYQDPYPIIVYSVAIL